MKAKTIKSVLRHKHDAWLASITDEGVRKLAAEGTIITGGAIASMLLAEKVNDYDLYFRDWKTCVAVADYYVRKFRENPPAKFKGDDSGHKVAIWLSDGGRAELGFKNGGVCMRGLVEGLPRSDDHDWAVADEPSRVKVHVKSAGVASETAPDTYQYFECNPDPESSGAADYVEAVAAATGKPPEEEKPDKEKPKFRPIFLTSNAITLSDGIQVVTRFYGEPNAIHENYDFAHCTCYWQSWDGKLELRPNALEALLARELRYVGSKYPLCSLIRTRKFIQRGWTINAGQFVKMAMQLNELDLMDMKVLEEQLTGVDAAYFLEIIDALKAKNETRVDHAYLMQLIDRIF